MRDLAQLVAELMVEQERVILNSAHRYRADGEWRPGTTTIGKVLDAPQLDAWKVAQEAIGVARAAYENPPMEDESVEAYVSRMSRLAALEREHERVSKVARDLGTEVHALIEDHVRRMLRQPTTRPSSSDEALSLFAGWKEWARATDFTPLAVEARFCNREIGYCGTVDLLAVVRDEVAVVDWKSKDRVYESQRLQSAAYRMGLRSLGWPEMAGYLVRIPHDGAAVSMVRLEDGPALQNSWLSFQSCLQLYRWQAALGKTDRAARKSAGVA